MLTARFAHLPALKGGLLALLAALLFGVSTPLVQRWGVGLGAFTTAALLYGGAALVGITLRRPADQEARLHRADLPRLLWMSGFGAVLGPVALAWGLQHTTGTGASLMLTLEAVFTAVLAGWLYGEALGRRVWGAVLLLLAGGVALVLEQGLQGQAGHASVWGLLAVLVGAAGYGLSLRFYLLAQRSFGAARTGSVYAFAPFVGAALAWILGDRSGGWGLMLSSVLMVAGIALHLMEKHTHWHDHEAVTHEHAHTHDDGHHLHPHDPLPSGAHSHLHRHEPMRHTHAHVPDAHHTHKSS
jgi:drug/metabolite transporter (DMT)-like permease